MKSDKVILNLKATPELKEAVRIVAFNQGHSNSSKTVLDILECNELISKEVRKLQRKNKNKVVSV